MHHLLAVSKTLARLVVPGVLVFALLALAVFGVGPRSGRYHTVTVLTGSMRPNMPEGSVVVSTPKPLRDVEVGDVITYRIPVEDRRTVTHRVVEIVRPGDHPVVVTKGDANAAADPWTAELRGPHVWEARVAVPKIGYVLEDLRSPLVGRLLLPVVCALLALLWLRDIWGEKGPEEERIAASVPLVPIPTLRPPRRRRPVVAVPLSPGAGRARSA